MASSSAAVAAATRIADDLLFPSALAGREHPVGDRLGPHRRDPGRHRGDQGLVVWTRMEPEGLALP
jgi:hypothetical protein